MTKPHPQSLAEAKFLLDSFDGEIKLNRDFLLRNDADATNALALQLENMKTKVVERKYSLVQSMEIIPMAGLETGYETLAWAEEEWSGSAKLIAPADITDLPTVESKKGKQYTPILPVGAMFTYSQFELERAALLGRPLSADKGVKVRRAVDRELDRILALGDTDTGLGGFINDSNVASASASATFGTTWQDDLDALNGLANALVNSSDEAWADNEAELILPRGRYQAISQFRASADNGETVLQAFLRANPWVRTVRTWQRLATAGAGSTNRAILWYRSPEIAEGHTSEFQMLPPNRRGLGFEVPAYRQTAGTTVYQPLGMRYLDVI